MKYLKIQNNGLLDHKLIGLIGGTTKDNDVYKIGEFGSGLKYAFAYFFRNNIDFKLFVGLNEVKFGLETEIIREKKFEIICIDGNRTSVTTKMGKEWLAWMVIRELWSNALDEGGGFREESCECIGEEDKTTFYIQINTEIQDVLTNWDKYFIHHLTPMYECDRFSIYTGGQTLKIYKQGILIHEQEEDALFSYDIKDAKLNELREFKPFISIDYALAKILSDSDKKIADYALSHLKEEHYEGSMDWVWGGISFSEQWREAIGSAQLIHQKAFDDLKSRGIPIKEGEVCIVPKNMFIRLNAQFKGISALRTSDKINEFYEIFDATLDLKIKSALATLETCGYFISPELKFLHGIFGDKTKLAQIDMDKKEILVSERMRDMTTFNFIAMIIEENEHFRTQYLDCSRPFQQHFIDLYTKTLLEKNSVSI